MSVLAALGPPVTRDEAREEALHELSKSIYKDAEPNWLVRVVEWIDDKITDFFAWLTPDPAAEGLGAFNGLGVLALVIVLIAVLVIVRMWLGPLRRSARAAGRDAVGLDSTLPSAVLREQAETAAARGAYADAVRARLRALVRMLEEKGVLDPRPGRTAGEIVLEVTRTAPEAAGPLGDAVTAFSEIWYGGRPATAASYEALVRADAALGSLRRGGRAAEDQAFAVPA